MNNESADVVPAVTVNRDLGRTPFQIIFMPVDGVLDGLDQASSGVMLVINDPDVQPLEFNQLLKIAFKLSDVESEIAQLICNGMVVSDIAIARSCSEHTVRFHLKNIYQKAGVKRQSGFLQQVYKTVPIGTF